MTMRLAKISGKLLAVLAISFLLVTVAGAQEGPAPKAHAHKAKAAGHVRHASAASPEQAPAAGTSAPVAAKRDPFVPLVNLNKDASNEHLPPGKAGLVIATVRVEGAVTSPDGMIAVVSNPEDHVYFVREGDHLYDGEVEKIGLDGVTFRENSKDAFGRPVERTVTKRIFAVAGEVQ
jgi:Tfp pilus assembly protein PilP